MKISTYTCIIFLCLYTPLFGGLDELMQAIEECNVMVVEQELAQGVLSLNSKYSAHEENNYKISQIKRDLITRIIQSLQPYDAEEISDRYRIFEALILVGIDNQTSTRVYQIAKSRNLEDAATLIQERSFGRLTSECDISISDKICHEAGV